MIENTIRVSVIIPAYNAEKWLTQAVACLKAQSFPYFEVIFVDDCSTDSTSILLQELLTTDSRFRTVRHSKNRGCGAARNTGLELAAGEYAICLDVDDRYEPNLLETMVYALDEYGADVAVCSSIIKDQKTGQTRQFGQWRRINAAFAEEIIVMQTPAACPNICELIDYVAWSKMFCLSYFREKRLWFPELKYYEDIPFSFLCCLLAQKAVFIRRPLIEYRIFGQNSMTSWTIPKQHYMADAFYSIFRRRHELDWDRIRIGFLKRALENIAAVWAREDTIPEDKQWILHAASTRLLPDWDVKNYLPDLDLSVTCQAFLQSVDGFVPSHALMLYGDEVGLCNLSDPLLPERQAELCSLSNKLTQIGLKTLFAPDLIPDTPNAGNTDANKRAQWLMNLYQQDCLSYIFDVSGGDIANKIIPLLDYSLIRNRNVTLAGYSDITCVLNAIYSTTGKPSILFRINNLYKDQSGEQTKRFQRTFCENNEDLFSFSYAFLRGSQMSGIVVGGNIRCLLKLAGTEFWPDMTGKILFLESLDDNIKTARAQIAQLKQLHVFEKVAGVLLGTFGIKERSEISDIDRCFESELPIQLPLSKTREIGHGYLSRAIWIGKELHIHR